MVAVVRQVGPHFHLLNGKFAFVPVNSGLVQLFASAEKSLATRHAPWRVSRPLNYGWTRILGMQLLVWHGCRNGASAIPSSSPLKAYMYRLIIVVTQRNVKDGCRALALSMHDAGTEL
nr:hypothetical protein CFP56_13194 [Quercus suber]